MSSEVLQIGLIGTGAIGRTHIERINNTLQGGRVIAASYWGKFKTASQMVMIILMILDLDALRVPETVFVYLALILTLVSMVDYLVKNRDIITSGGI